MKVTGVVIWRAGWDQGRVDAQILSVQQLLRAQCRFSWCVSWKLCVRSVSSVWTTVITRLVQHATRLFQYMFSCVVSERAPAQTRHSNTWFAFRSLKLLIQQQLFWTTTVEVSMFLGNFHNEVAGVSFVGKCETSASSNPDTRKWEKLLWLVKIEALQRLVKSVGIHIDWLNWCDHNTSTSWREWCKC